MNANRSMTLIGTALVIAAAGGSDTATAGIDGSGIITLTPKVTRGPVSGFGSVYVNGVRYNTNSAVFLIDGSLGSESDLAVGQVVTVLGTVDDEGTTGTAHLVTFEDRVEGPISSIDADANRMSVMGQTVLVGMDTVFALSGSGAGMSHLNIDDVVEVSGYVDSNGAIVAASVRSGDASGEYDLTGTVGSVDAGAMRLTVNGLGVDFGAAGLFGLPDAMPRAGDTVEVIGNGYDESGTFVASRIYGAEEGFAGISGVAAEIDGVVTGFHTLSEFDLSGTRVRLTWHTRYVNDWVFGLSRDRRVQVRGVIEDDGVVVADEIIFDVGATEVLSGSVNAVADDYLIVDHRLVRVTPETIYLDESELDDRRFHIGSVRRGNSVEVRGYGSAGMLNATMLTRVDNEGTYDDEDDHDSTDD